jgi:hypothetical protein
VIAYNVVRGAGVKSRRRERCEVPGARIQELGRSWKAGFRIQDLGTGAFRERSK